MNIEQKLSQLLLQGKNFSAKNIRNVTDKKTLFTDLCQYPNKGINFKAYKRHWPKGKYYKITSVNFERQVGKGQVFGVLYEFGSNQSKYPQLIEDAHFKNTWNHEPAEDDVELENSMKFTQRHYDLFYKINYPNKKSSWQLIFNKNIANKIYTFQKIKTKINKINKKQFNQFIFYFSFFFFIFFYCVFFLHQNLNQDLSNSHMSNHSINHKKLQNNHYFYINLLFCQQQNLLNDKNKKYKRN